MPNKNRGGKAEASSQTHTRKSRKLQALTSTTRNRHRSSINQASQRRKLPRSQRVLEQNPNPVNQKESSVQNRPLSRTSTPKPFNQNRCQNRYQSIFSNSRKRAITLFLRIVWKIRRNNWRRRRRIWLTVSKERIGWSVRRQGSSRRKWRKESKRIRLLRNCRKVHKRRIRSSSSTILRKNRQIIPRVNHTWPQLKPQSPFQHGKRSRVKNCSIAKKRMT